MVGTLLIIIGASISLTGYYTLGKYYRPWGTPKGLVKNGIYSKIRHPIYLGSLFFWAGICLLLHITPQMWWLYFIFTLNQVRRACVEDLDLNLQYREEFKEYYEKTWF